jgi:hypothetical protein
MELLVELQQLVKFFQPLFQRKIGNPLHPYRVRKPVDGFTAAKIEVPAARSQRLVASAFPERVVYHLSSYAARFGFGLHRVCP